MGMFFLELKLQKLSLYITYLSPYLSIFQIISFVT